MEEIKNRYIEMYKYMVDKNEKGLEDVLDDLFILHHMTGLKQSKKEYIDAIMDGTLNYYSAKHEDMNVTINGNKALLIGKSYVEARVFGGGRGFWRLKLTFELIKRDEKWYFISSKASIY